MALWQAILLGAVQGLTEFVPVSSTAHLFLLQKFLGVSGGASLSFDIVLHLGTALALLVAFRDELAGMVAEAVRFLVRRPMVHPEDRSLIAPLLLGTVPGVLAGVLLLKHFDEARTVAIVAVSMLAACAYFFTAEAYSDRRVRERPERTQVTISDAVWVGIAQAAAGLMAGFSRSGLTIATGRGCGLTRESAARFSFLLAFVIILGAGAKTLLDLHRHPEPSLSPGVLAAGFAASAVVGLLAIQFLLRYLKTHSLRPFGMYLGLFGAALLIASAL